MQHFTGKIHVSTVHLSNETQISFMCEKNSSHITGSAVRITCAKDRISKHLCKKFQAFSMDSRMNLHVLPVVYRYKDV